MTIVARNYYPVGNTPYDDIYLSKVSNKNGVEQMSLGSKLRSIRKSRNWSAEYLGKRAGCTQSTISDIETNKRSPQIDTLEKIATALDMTLVELLPIEYHLADGSTLSDEEKEMIHLLHKMTDEQRKAVFNLIHAFLKE